MAKITNISWCDSTFNPFIGCQPVSPGCDNCYAKKWVERYGGDFSVRRRTKTWGDPVRWNKQPFCECMDCHWRGDARDAELKTDVPGTEIGSGAWRICPNCKQPTLKEARQRVFCASLADVFDNEVSPEWRRDLFALIRATPNLDWLLLTKRIGNADRMLAEALSALPLDEQSGTGQWNHAPIAQWPWPNVWLGATVVNQEEADRDIPKLLAVPAAKRFLSIEPMLGPVNLGPWLVYCDRLDKHGISRRTGGEHIVCDAHCGISWVIVGGESGPGARPSHPDWHRSLRDQCAAAGVPFLFKQNGEWVSVSEVAGPGTHHYFEDGATVRKTGKKLAGRLLDGIEHNGFPS